MKSFLIFSPFLICDILVAGVECIEGDNKWKIVCDLNDLKNKPKWWNW